MTPEEKDRIWDGIRQQLAERKAAHEEAQRQQRVQRLIAWLVKR